MVCSQFRYPLGDIPDTVTVSSLQYYRFFDSTVYAVQLQLTKFLAQRFPAEGPHLII